MVATTSTQVAASWTSLGTGPLKLQAVEGEVFIEIADSSPAPGGASGFVLKPQFGPRDFNTTSTLWAYAVVTATKATVISAPVTA